MRHGRTTKCKSCLLLVAALGSARFTVFLAREQLCTYYDYKAKKRRFVSFGRENGVVKKRRIQRILAQ